jgi:magnesium transporter
MAKNRRDDAETTLVAGSPPLVPTVISSLPLETAIEAFLERKDARGLGAFLATQAPPDLADVVDRLPEDERNTVFDLLEPSAAAAVLSELGIETANRILDRLTPDQAADLLEVLPADDAATVIADSAPEQSEALLARMNPEAAEDVRALLRYPENSAGRLMTDKFVRVTASMTAGEVFEHLRTVGSDVETFSDLYVLEKGGILTGVVSLRQVVLAPSDAPLGDLMTRKVVTAAPTDDQEVVARLVAHYDLMALPVVLDGKMIGVVTVDDVIDVLIEEGTEDQLKFGAVEPGVLDQPYFTTPIWRVVRSRLGWLLLLFVAETSTGTVLRHFEDELARVVALSFFIPLLVGTGGNTGAQTVSTIIRGIALKEIRLRDTARVVFRELLSGLLLGTLLAAVGFGRALVWGSGFELSLVVALTLVAIVTWANTIGSLIPLLAHRFKIDPALVSAPLITTLVDASGLAIYLTIAKFLIDALR